MDTENPSRKDMLLYLIFASTGLALVFLSFWLGSQETYKEWADLPLNVGATLISTAILAFIYYRLGSRELVHQIVEMRRSLYIAQRGLELGVRDMWRERRKIPSDMWNKITSTAKTEVCLLGVAENGYAEDPKFHYVVSEGTAHGCRFRFLLLNPDSDAAMELDRKEGGVLQVQGRIRSAMKQFQTLQINNAGKRGLIELRLYRDAPRVSIVRSDDELLVTPYMPPLLGNSSFTFYVQKAPDGIFTQYVNHFEALWEQAETPL